MNTAILFPGQGAQSIGMLSDLNQAFPSIAETFQEASDALGYDLWSLTQNGPEDQLNKTEITQPAILTASIALWRLYHQQKANPSISFMAGHSLGEYSALVAAGVIGLQDGVKLVQLRGQLMQKSVEGQATAMAAILGLDDQAVIDGCREVAVGECVEAVNFNCPGQVVIAGVEPAVERAIVALKEKGAKRALKLAVSVPSHCALMKPAAEKLAEHIGAMSFNKPSTPIVQNVGARSVDDLAELKDNLIKQLFSPVLWTQSVQYISEKGVDSYVECGPGKVLAGLVKKIDRAASIQSLSDAEVWNAL
ncbi:ACP S-malonyltransferase [Hahella aquimaris]|uniref:ACP S-malonyltransferase n=1 Tax=Hahella sp. HNIBRBA332 TaxID=3015983 RepID=UPI00273B50B3|nr:ACP S-malonyltransferase [Hahella sp. HNIBRBA332]WLQ15280.1 ACP S-malonyltransferase [Hahella sp. HNIBRBA332]